MSDKKTFLFITSCPEIWGGSEELWSGAAVALKQRGHRVLCGRTEPARHWKSHPKWKALREAGVEVGAFSVPVLLRAIPDAFLRYAYRFSPLAYGLRNRLLSFWIRRLNPDLVIVAQGNTFDGMCYVEIPLLAHAAEKPFVLVCQKNSETEWPDDGTRERSMVHFRRARRIYFVSEHNRSMAEHQLGMALENSEIARNPFLINTRKPLPWPESPEGTFQLACVGRLFIREKGQDVLLQVLSRPKWKARPVSLDFYGTGSNAKGLMGMAEMLGLTNVRFLGFTDDVAGIWKTHHALVLPSRAEGLPLAQVEAMICGRVTVMGCAGGASEIIEDGVTGFVTSSPDEDSLDEALERAWERRQEWRDIGLRASESIWRHFPENPCADFADKLEEILTPGAKLEQSEKRSNLKIATKGGVPSTWNPSLSEKAAYDRANVRPLVYLSTCTELWGGSEELWSGAARVAALRGLKVAAFKYGKTDPLDRRHALLRESGVPLESTERWLRRKNAIRLMNRFLPQHIRWSGVRETQPYLLRRMIRIRPDLAVISQSDNFDGLEHVCVCRCANVPYVLICHKASDFNWPADSIRPFLREIFMGAARVFFVSEHNRDLTERQIGIRLNNAEVVRNPYLVDYHEPPLPYPDPQKDGVYRLACVARFWVPDKGQDVLLEVLAQEKWKQRPLEVSFFGGGENLRALRDLANLLGATGAKIRDFRTEVAEIWHEHHALILPSRAEGLPLAQVEAMLCGRISICTAVGGMPEILEEGSTGFLAESPSPAAIDEALERAWEKRDEWGTMGARAAERIRTMIPSDPCEIFADKIELIRSEVRSIDRR
jgi:glycosyltransferase involved in cell wall biosynthesis